jgi:hypothetical protein
MGAPVISFEMSRGSYINAVRSRQRGNCLLGNDLSMTVAALATPRDKGPSGEGLELREARKRIAQLEPAPERSDDDLTRGIPRIHL